jgi:hypothetical protein
MVPPYPDPGRDLYQIPGKDGIENRFGKPFPVAVQIL